MTISLSDQGTLIYSDYEGALAGYENFVVYSGAYSKYRPNYFRHVSVPILMQADAGTYHCSVYEFSAGPSGKALVEPESRVAREVHNTRLRRAADTISDNVLLLSGGLTIVVNTKSDQALSTRAQSTQITAYSLAIMTASKLLF